MPITIVATDQPTSTPAPSILVALSGLTGATVSVWRLWDGKRVELRGALNAAVLGSTREFVDYEAPFGIAVSYLASTYTSLGVTIETSQSNNAYLNVDKVWISDPLAPNVATPVTLDKESLATYNLTREGTIAPINATPTSVGILGIRRAPSRIPVNILCRTTVEMELALAVLKLADPFLMRCPADLTRFVLPPLSYCTSDNLQPRFYAGPQGSGSYISVLAMTVDLVAPPAVDVVIPPRTYGNVLVENSTYADILANYTDYAALARGYN